jgi:hypothetical protein
MLWYIAKVVLCIIYISSHATYPACYHHLGPSSHPPENPWVKDGQVSLVIEALAALDGQVARV